MNGRSSGSEALSAPTSFSVARASLILLKWSGLIIPMSALSLWLAISQTSEIDPEYTSEVSLLLVGPNTVLINDFENDEVYVDDVNPLNNLGGSLSTVAEVTALSVQTDVAERLESEGLATDVVVWVPTKRTPIISAEAIGDDVELVEATTDRMAEMIIADLEDRQNGLDAPATKRISAEQIAASSAGPPDYGGRNRVRIAIAVVGIGLSVATAILFEGVYQLFRRFRLRRKARRASKASDVGKGDAVPSVTTEEKTNGSILGSGNGSISGEAPINDVGLPPYPPRRPGSDEAPSLGVGASGGGERG